MVAIQKYEIIIITCFFFLAKVIFGVIVKDGVDIVLCSFATVTILFALFFVLKPLTLFSFLRFLTLSLKCGQNKTKMKLGIENVSIH